ncbi:hypothetical protein RQP46_010790 [Phenoliferia psychrophenolica]
MTSLQFLPSELLAHILHLSNEGESAAEQQRAHFSFRLIARPFFLAIPDATDFYVAGHTQAMALAVKLEREKSWAVQEERKARSGRTTRATLSITRISHIRRLVLVLDGKGTKGFVKIPRFMGLEDALSGLASLSELQCRGKVDENSIQRILKSLRSLKVLDLPINNYRWCVHGYGSLDAFALPLLRNLRIILQSLPEDFANLFLSSNPTIQILDLYSTAFQTIKAQVVDPLLPAVGNST